MKNYIYKAGELVELVGYSITYDINHDVTIPMITIPYYTYNKYTYNNNTWLIG